MTTSITSIIVEFAGLVAEFTSKDVVAHLEQSGIEFHPKQVANAIQTLRKAGKLESIDKGVYAQVVDMDEDESENTELSVSLNTPVLPEVTETSEVVESTMVYSHYQPVSPVSREYEAPKAPKAERKPVVKSDNSEHTDEDFEAVLKEIEESASEIFEITRIDASKTRSSIRFKKNDYAIRAIEVFKKNVFRFYCGKALPEDLVAHLEQFDVVVKEGTHYYYDMTIENHAAILAYFN